VEARGVQCGPVLEDRRCFLQGARGPLAVYSPSAVSLKKMLVEEHAGSIVYR